MSKEEFIVDRIEDEYLVLETSEGKRLDINNNKVVGEAKEGDILIKENNIYVLDIERTQKRRDSIRKLMKGMWE